MKRAALYIGKHTEESLIIADFAEKLGFNDYSLFLDYDAMIRMLNDGYTDVIVMKPDRISKQLDEFMNRIAEINAKGLKITSPDGEVSTAAIAKIMKHLIHREE
jgi:hypothetical protein